MVKRTTIVLLVFLLCFVNSFAEQKAETKEAVKYNTSEGMPDLAKLKFKTTPSGLKYVDTYKGEDFVNPGLGQTAVVHYTGWLMDGRKFDSSLDRNEPFKFRIGSSRVIKGWDEGVSLMEKGATRILVIPPELGYGKKGSPTSSPRIPPNATLVFKIELIDIK